MSKIYCAFCGRENDSKDKTCQNNKCKRELDPKSHLFKNYVIDKCKGDIDDSIFEIIFKFLKSNLYGILLSASVIATSVILITNGVSNNYIEELKEEPKFVYARKYEYLGEGLDEEEIVNKYLDYVKSGDIEKAKGLIAENFLTKEQLAELPYEGMLPRYYHGIKHDFIISNKKYFDHLTSVRALQKDLQGGRFGMLYATQNEKVVNDKFAITSFYMELQYCYQDNCDKGSIVLMEILETIKVDNKVYILSEYALVPDNYTRVQRYIFNEHNGDFSNYDEKQFYEVMDSCIDEYGKVICNLPLPEYGEE